MVQINNQEFIDKYTKLILNAYTQSIQSNLNDISIFNKINSIVTNALQRMLYENKLWTQTETITFLTEKILFDKPFEYGNKKIGFTLLLNELGINKFKIFEICNFLWNK